MKYVLYKRIPKLFVIGLLIITLIATNNLGLVIAQDNTDSTKSVEGSTRVKVTDETIDPQSSPSVESVVVKWKWTLTTTKSTVKVKLERTSGILPIFGSGLITIKDSKGNETATYELDSSAVTNTAKTWTWSKPISSTTVEETIELDAVVSVDDNISLNSLEVTRNNFVGGKYSSIKALDGQRHHCFHADAYTKTPVYKLDDVGNPVGSRLNSSSGPVILMVTADHRETTSCGGGPNASKYRADQLGLVKAGQYIEAMNMDEEDIQDLFDDKYDYAIAQMYDYAMFTLGWTE